MNSIWRFWGLVFLIWIFSTGVDRLWWGLFDGIPSWDQADYLNSALDHGRALGILPGGEWQGWNALLDLSPKIPPLASLINGSVIALAGDLPQQAAWSLSLWNGLLLVAIAAWGLQLRGPGFALLAVAFTAVAPALLILRTDYVLELPLTSVTVLALWKLGCWCDPKRGFSWTQALVAAILLASAVLIKQSALLVLFPSLIWAIWIGARRSHKTRSQLIASFGLSISLLLPWLHHNWITTLGGTNRAVIESAAREGDPSLLTLDNWLWYLKILPDQLGPLLLIISLSGGLLWFFIQLKDGELSRKLNINDDFFSWKWLLINLLMGWILTTLSPNKGDRYITPLIPLLLLVFARFWWQWGLCISHWWPSRSKKLLHPTLLLGVLATIPSGFSVQMTRFFQGHQGPLAEIVKFAGGANPQGKLSTVIVVPSTPDLNQHNFTYFGRRNGGHLIGRQLGSSQKDVKPVLRQAQLVLLAEGEQGSVRDSAILLDKAVRTSGNFLEINRFKRPKGGSYSLWERRPGMLTGPDFASRFPDLARGLQRGPQGLEEVFSIVAIEHMLDGHFSYREKVRDEAMKTLSINSSDLDSLWSLGLLEVLSNRPREAAIYFQALEEALPESPWPSIYLSVVVLADWNPMEAAQISNTASKKHHNQTLHAIKDLTSVLSGALWRIPEASTSLPRAIRQIQNSINP